MSAARSIPGMESERSSAKVWIGAAVVALAVHAGCIAFAVARMPAEEEADELGAPAIEIGVEVASPRAEATDLPPGPDAEASAASPAATEQKAEVKEADLPKALPEVTEDPDRIVTQDDSKNPKEEEAEKAAVQTTASVESTASEATAMPSVETPREAQKAVAPARGTGEAARRQRASWQKQLITHLDKHKRYPAGGAQKSAQIVINFSLDRVGHVQDVKVVKGSGDAAFDAAAVAMVRRSDPVPAPPPVVADDGLSFTLPVIFRVKGRG